MNDNFYNTAFNDKEKEYIVPIDIIEATYSTTDNVFLLSYDEANTYFDDNTARLCTPTVYARKQGCATYSSAAYTSCYWWLRTYEDIGYAADGFHIFNVHTDGSFKTHSVSATKMAVRPALWIDLNLL